MSESVQDNLLIDLLKERIDEHIVRIQNSSEYEQNYKELEYFYNIIRGLMQEDASKFILEMDNCITNIIIMFEGRLYAQGFRDGIRSK